ncbi:CDP-diacylglycerol--glycerol-3-phosphate 3-phosphatidyltransferase, mitochondrial [Alosa pseudoharengus]|uniref:CDP-diacylglycerol--glycerol-3-phosphate 3-phosphatidyltransferase, mitochondrial n=1 Tax=Alosa pseudoharengus TaxID=34774 RepID=UPI003F88E8F9
MAAPMSWRRLVYSVYTPALSGVFTRISDKFFRKHDRRRGSSLLLLAPLLAEAELVPVPPSRPPSSVEGLHARFRWMADHVPAFRVPGARVHILHSPEEFYQVMKARIKTAKSRVVMASLYLGTGPLEQDLVDCMEEALERSQNQGSSPDLQVSMLLDYTRGSRGKNNSRTMLLPLLQRFPDQMRVSLYHTPDLRGLLRLLVPERFNETIGVQHIKAYLFDDSLIISGANLSDSYFTNRQDRYVLLEDCPEVANFFADLVGAVGDVSLQLQPDDSVHMLDGMVHPYKVSHCLCLALPGLWYYLDGSDRPCLTLIGSPNFGYRSVHRDLEAQIAIVTENEELQAQLQQEQEMLYKQSSEVSGNTFKQPDRYVKLWVKLVTPLIKNFF